MPIDDPVLRDDCHPAARLLDLKSGKPLDVQAELHLRSDRTALAYRRWLGQLGLSFGTPSTRRQESGADGAQESRVG